MQLTCAICRAFASRMQEIKCFDCDTTTNLHHLNLTRDTQQDENEPTRNYGQCDLIHCALFFIQLIGTEPQQNSINTATNIEVRHEVQPPRSPDRCWHHCTNRTCLLRCQVLMPMTGTYTELAARPENSSEWPTYWNRLDSSAASPVIKTPENFDL